MRLYRSFSRLNVSEPIPQPNAAIIVPISWFWKIFCRRAFSTFKIFPRMGRIAWNLRSLPCFAEPPAESPSTIYTSHFSGSFSKQSISFPGRRALSKALFLKVNSLAFFAASLACAAMKTFSTISLAICGFSSKKCG